MAYCESSPASHQYRAYLSPPYSPELNPTEHLWDELREKYFGNEVFKSLDAVEDQLVKGLGELENDTTRIASITGFNWIVSTKSNAN